MARFTTQPVLKLAGLLQTGWLDSFESSQLFVGWFLNSPTAPKPAGWTASKWAGQLRNRLGGPAGFEMGGVDRFKTGRSFIGWF